MLAARIDERRGGGEPDHVDPPAEQGIALGTELRHDGGKGELAVEPRFHRMVVGGRDVGRGRCHQSADMRRYDLTYELVAGLLVEGPEGQRSGQDCSGEEGGRKVSPRAAST